MSAEVRPSEMERARRALARARERIEALERRDREPIAIVGMACRFPGADDVEAFRRLLEEGRDAIREAPSDRWDAERFYSADPEAPGRFYYRHGGFLDGVDLFDAEFFGVSPREAERMDPQQRLLLETAWHALEDAGHAPEAGERTGVFVGIGQHDYLGEGLYALDPEEIGAYDGTGNGFCFASGRISNWLGLRGPSLAVDTACSSALTAVDEACRNLRRRACDVALAGGVHLALRPEINVFLARTRSVAPDGRSKAFDRSADGFGRGEGCGVVTLKRLSDAERAGDRVIAVIRGSAINHDGATGGLTVPSQTAQEEVIRQALAEAGLAPDEIGYVEAHGTGTPLGDPIEVAALDGVFGRREQPLWIGSVKANIGHLEAAAGMAGVIKTALAVGSGRIYPHLYSRDPSPRIPWAETSIRLADESSTWDGTRRAGVSAFGMSGSNAHVVLEQPQEVETTAESAGVLTVSAPTLSALRSLAERYVDRLRDGADWGDVCTTTNLGRRGFRHRLAASTREEALERLRADVEPEAVEAEPRIGFLFTGQGAQYAAMGMELYASEPVFRNAFDRCSTALGRDLREVFGDERRLRDTANTQPALFALQAALCELWAHWGVLPRVLLGHSVGELAAAAAAGVFSVEDGVNLAAERGRLMSALPRDGSMAAISLEPEALEERLRRWPELAVAAVNGPRQVVVSGPTASLDGLLREVRDSGVRTIGLETSHAFHSALMEPMMPAFGEAARRVAYRPPRVALVSDVSGKLASGEVATPDYWVDHVRRPVAFAAGMRAMDDYGCDAYLEIGPQPVLVGLGRTIVAGARQWLASLMRGQSDLGTARSTLARLWESGAPIDWRAFHEGRKARKVALPLYPFERRPYWVQGRKRPTPPRTRASVYRTVWRDCALSRGQAHGNWAVVGEPALAQALRDAGAGLTDAAQADVLLLGGKDVSAWLRAVQSMRPEAALWAVEREVGPASAFVRAALLERPESSGGTVEADSWDDAVAVIAAGPEEERIAVRAGGGRAARLAVSDVANRPAAPIRDDARYLITGGVGAVGLAAAQALLDAGARHLTLVARRDPSPGVSARIADWRARGAVVEVCAADVADRPAMECVLTSDGLPFRGVIHAAGVPGRKPLALTTAADCEQVWRAKVQGAELLDQLTRAMELDFFAMMSSVAALWGSAEQAPYAAANAALDRLATRRRAQGLAAVSVQWGPWASGGMATQADLEALARMGVHGIDPREASELLPALLSAEEAVVAVADVDWERFIPIFNARRRHRLFDELAAGPEQPVASQVPVNGEWLDTVRREAAACLGHADAASIAPRKGFFEMGMDSLTAVDLKTRLERLAGRTLPATVAFDYPDPERLAAHLRELTTIKEKETEISDSHGETTAETLEEKLERVERLAARF